MAKTEPTLKQELAQLEALLEWFENPDTDIDEAIKKFEQGLKLAESASDKLAKLENRIHILKQKFDVQ